MTFRDPLNVPPVKVPETFSVTIVPDVPAEVGKDRLFVTAAPAAMLPTLIGRDVLVFVDPREEAVMLTPGAVLKPVFLSVILAV